jgi:hypothetical protein
VTLGSPTNRYVRNLFADRFDYVNKKASSDSQFSPL